MQPVQSQAWLVKSKLQVPLAQSLSFKQLSFGV
jgi:hypothetical protein